MWLRCRSELRFVRLTIWHFRVRLLVVAVVLIGGALSFMWLEPEKNHSFLRGLFYTYSLIFGEPPEEFPQSAVLQFLFFVMPILGLVVIIETIIEVALIMRDRRRFERRWCVMLASSYKDHVIIIGLGRLGFRTYALLRRLNIPVVVIERDEHNQFLEAVREDDTPLLIGDARRDVVLRDANIDRAATVVCATNDDMTNLEAALDARQMNSNIRVVLRMFDQNMADKVRDGFNIHLAMSQSALAAPTFAACAVAPATINSVIIGDRLVAMQRVLVRKNDSLCQKTVADVIREYRLNVVEHHRPGVDRVCCPDPDTRLLPGDGVLLQGPLESLEQFRSQAISDAVGATTTP